VAVVDVTVEGLGAVLAPIVFGAEDWAVWVAFGWVVLVAVALVVRVLRR